MRWYLVLQLLFLSVGWPITTGRALHISNQASSQAEKHIIEAEEYEVYSALLKEMYAAGYHLLVIEDRTFNPDTEWEPQLIMLHARPILRDTADDYCSK